jgi:hypothetical protein
VDRRLADPGRLRDLGDRDPRALASEAQDRSTIRAAWRASAASGRRRGRSRAATGTPGARCAVVRDQRGSCRLELLELSDERTQRSEAIVNLPDQPVERQPAVGIQLVAVAHIQGLVRIGSAQERRMFATRPDVALYAWLC